MSELQTLRGYLNQLPATFLKLFNVEPPLNVIPEPIQPILDLYQDIERIFLVVSFFLISFSVAKRLLIAFRLIS